MPGRVETPRRARMVVLGLALLGGCLAAAPAVAQPTEPGIAIPFGLNIGAGFDPDGRPGFLLGGEVSVAFFDQSPGEVWWWYGAYVDAVYDFGADAVRASIGPEAGFMLVGVDGGLVVQRRAGRSALGVNGRLMLSLAVVHVYVRAGAIGEVSDGAFSEVGVLLKLPWLVQFTP